MAVSIEKILSHLAQRVAVALYEKVESSPSGYCPLCEGLYGCGPGCPLAEWAKLSEEYGS